MVGWELCGVTGALGRNGRDISSLKCRCGGLVLRIIVRTVRSIFGGSGDQETFFFDLGVSGTKLGVMIGDTGKEKCFCGEEAAEGDFSGELGAVLKSSSPLLSESPIGRATDSEAIS